MLYKLLFSFVLLYIFKCVCNHKLSDCIVDHEINSSNIDGIVNCKTILGNVIISNLTFREMHPSKLELLSSVTNVTGSLRIYNAYHTDFTNLSFLRNLEAFGENLSNKLQITMDIYRTSLKSLDFQSLKSIAGGADISITNNEGLCYVDGINWSRISAVERIIVVKNRPVAECRNDGFICDERCSEDGCWGAGSEMCLNCKGTRHASTCMLKCETISCESFCKFGCYGKCPKHCDCSGRKHICSDCQNIQKIDTCYHTCAIEKYRSNGQCEPCHKECLGECRGPKANECLACKHFKDGEDCVSSCSENKYSQKDICIACNDQCKNGCIGSNADQCRSCKNVKDEQHCVTTCPRHKYTKGDHCIACNDQCKSACTGPYTDQCNSCKTVKDGRHCMTSCPVDKYSKGGYCIACHHQCEDGCTGPDDYHCIACKNYRDGQHCVEKCPIGKYTENKDCVKCHEVCNDSCTGPDSIYGDGGCNSCNKIIESNNIIICMKLGDPCPSLYLEINVTTKDKLLNNFNGQMCILQRAAPPNIVPIIIIIIIVTIIVLVMIVSSGFYLLLLCRQKDVSICNYIDLVKIEEFVDYHYGLSQLHLIKETDLDMIKILGKGAFGTVHEAVCRSDAYSNSIPVAVKVLHHNTTLRSTKEFLNEAAIIAAMNHPNIIHLFAICATPKIMLITELMPLGCLLNYVSNNEALISPKTMFMWILQIAKGMAYLEEKYLVHGGLTARNVLLETIDCIKIIDFGLFKFIGIDESLEADMKCTTKWLAIECFEEGIYTHESDVWAFGVTIWEILTYGQTPYGEIQGHQLLKELKIGSRLKQPPICNADMYAILRKCWEFEPKHRPNFVKLECIFKQMSYQYS